MCSLGKGLHPRNLGWDIYMLPTQPSLYTPSCHLDTCCLPTETPYFQKRTIFHMNYDTYMTHTNRGLAYRLIKK